MARAPPPAAARPTCCMRGRGAHSPARIHSTPTSRIFTTPMTLTTGPTAATATSTGPARQCISRRMLLGTTIWMITASGAMIQIMEISGFPPRSLMDGRPITRATGIGFLPGVGRGWMMLPGVTRHFTMDAG